MKVLTWLNTNKKLLGAIIVGLCVTLILTSGYTNPNPSLSNLWDAFVAFWKMSIFRQILVVFAGWTTFKVIR